MDFDSNNSLPAGGFGKGSNDSIGKSDSMIGKSIGFGDKSGIGRSSLNSFYAQAQQRNAARAAKMKEHAIQRAQDPMKADQIKKAVYSGATRESERADRVAKSLLPKLSGIIPGSVGSKESSRELFGRVFKKPDAYVRRTAVKELGRAVEKGDRSALSRAGFKSDEVGKIFQSDKNRKDFIKAIKDITD